MVVGDVSARTPGSSLEEALRPHELQDRYDAYRRRQATRLVQMIPREAVRPLYRRAREARRLGALGDPGDDDPLALLVAFCQRLLPLPPFDAWLEDLRTNP
ncbi:MAG TPA: hypothetical protein VJ997_09960, partial [Longimicrobiales bacterium]|nr:hypothetical protein [Longimicrobiales bacterium]